MMQQAINLDEERGSHIGYSDYKIRRFPYRLEVKFYKYSALHPIAAGHEEVWEGGLVLKKERKQKKRKCKIKCRKKCYRQGAIVIIITLGYMEGLHAGITK